MVEFEPDVVLHTGDLVADGTKKEHWKPQFFDPLRPLAAQAPVIPCMGNHENNSGLYYQYFNRADGESWFSYRWANVHFLVLDSQKPVKSGTEQFHWLEKELATPKPDWRIVFCHYPMFSCHPTRDVNENRWAWQDLFDRTGVDLVLTGHDHYYHRTHRIGRAWDPTSRGVYHITTAGGGASLYPVEQKIYTAKAESVHHFMILDIDGKRLEGEVLSVDGKLIDTFTIDRAAPEQTPFVSYEMVQWEKALNEAIDPIQPEAIGAGEGRIERKVKLPALSGYDASISVRWTGGSSFWAADLCESIVPTVPDKPFEVAIWARALRRPCIPMPRLELTPVRGPAAAKAFVNPSIVLHPLRVSTNRLLRAPKLSTEVKVDGKLDDAAWSRAAIANGFTRDFGTIRSGREAFQVGYDDKGILRRRAYTILDRKAEGPRRQGQRHAPHVPDGRVRFDHLVAADSAAGLFLLLRQLARHALRLPEQRHPVEPGLGVRDGRLRERLASGSSHPMDCPRSSGPAARRVARQPLPLGRAGQGAERVDRDLLLPRHGSQVRRRDRIRPCSVKRRIPKADVRRTVTRRPAPPATARSRWRPCSQSPLPRRPVGRPCRRRRRRQRLHRRR
jgi:hypothetical protein